MLVELLPTVSGAIASYTPIGGGLNVEVLRQVPENDDRSFEIAHLPEDVEGFFKDALVVLGAGVPDAAAVQLRRTLEAAAAHKEIREGTLVQSIQKLIDTGAVTVDFSEVLHYVRKLGNLGAHFTDEKLTEVDVQRALRFTAQLLRNLFEVPGELAALKDATEKENGTGSNRASQWRISSSGSLRPSSLPGRGQGGAPHQPNDLGPVRGGW